MRGVYTLRKSCRACGYGNNPNPDGSKSLPTNEKLIKVFDLGIQPLANDFCSEGDTHHGFAPLEVMFCPRCSLAQLSVVVDDQILYRNYKYVTSQSQMMQKHFERLYNEIKTRMPEMQKVLEIGSNDGTYLNWLAGQGCKVCGIDPAENLHPETVDSITDIFRYGSADEARQKLGGPADVIIARHVFCHVDNWMDFMTALDRVSHAETLIAIEVPYVLNLLENTEFDTVYHEHSSYMSFKAMTALLDRTNFRLHDIVDFEIHGGASCLFIRHKHSIHKPNEAAMERVAKENITVDDWRHFRDSTGNLINELKTTVNRATSNHKTGCAFGASAKCTVLMNACGFTRKDIAFVTDTTKWKWHKTVPGTDIPIVDEGALLREMPDFAIMCAWNYASEILTNNKLYTDKGGKFLIPIPEVQIVP